MHSFCTWCNTLINYYYWCAFQAVKSLALKTDASTPLQQPLNPQMNWNLPQYLVWLHRPASYLPHFLILTSIRHSTTWLTQQLPKTKRWKRVVGLYCHLFSEEFQSTESDEDTTFSYLFQRCLQFWVTNLVSMLWEKETNVRLSFSPTKTQSVHCRISSTLCYHNQSYNSSNK